MAEEHSEEMDYAIWRLYQKGDDVRTIGHKLKTCELHVSRKYINLAIRRANVIRHSVRYELDLANQEVDGLDDQDNLEQEGQMETNTGEIDDTPASIHIPIGETTIEQGTEISTEPVGSQVATDLEIEMSIKSEDEDGELDLSPKKTRRIKTTDDLIRRLHDDFRAFPDMKVKDRAAKFGIAVGTLCQIKHNILKMPKESGRTWKSTPQMVEDVAMDMQLNPNLKVKERAKKFGISVGTLCRIMHDLLELPKRQVHRSGEKRGSKKKTETVATVSPVFSLTQVKEEAHNLVMSKRSRKRQRNGNESGVSFMGKSGDKTAMAQLCQMQFKEGNGQVLLVTFDPAMAAHLGAGESGLPLSVSNNGADDLIWVVNTGPEAEQSTSSNVTSDAATADAHVSSPVSSGNE